MDQQSNDRIGIMRDEPAAASLMKLGIPTMIGMLISVLYNAIDAYSVSGFLHRLIAADLYRIPSAVAKALSGGAQIADFA